MDGRRGKTAITQGIHTTIEWVYGYSKVESSGKPDELAKTTATKDRLDLRCFLRYVRDELVLYKGNNSIKNVDSYIGTEVA